MTLGVSQRPPHQARLLYLYFLSGGQSVEDGYKRLCPEGPAHRVLRAGSVATALLSAALIWTYLWRLSVAR
jgi:hypothetical protein